jgi:hypothetical protein
MLAHGTSRALVITMVLGCIFGCDRGHGGQPALSPDAVRISKQDPDSSCTFVTMVKGDSDDNYEELREDAADEGANYIVLDGMESSSFGYAIRSEMVGRAFQCPQGSR